MALKSPVEPAAHEAGRITRHLGVAGAALAVVLAAALVGGEIVEEALGGGGGLRVSVSWWGRYCGDKGRCRCAKLQEDQLEPLIHQRERKSLVSIKQGPTTALSY